jgi:hypothetical protein
MQCKHAPGQRLIGQIPRGSNARDKQGVHADTSKSAHGRFFDGDGQRPVQLAFGREAMDHACIVPAYPVTAVFVDRCAVGTAWELGEVNEVASLVWDSGVGVVIERPHLLCVGVRV